MGHRSNANPWLLALIMAQSKMLSMLQSKEEDRHAILSLMPEVLA
jgi:hypothetical protein